MEYFEAVEYVLEPTAVRLDVEENQLVDALGEIGVVVDRMKGA